ncbi:MFS transporter [Thalassotalea fusca]
MSVTIEQVEHPSEKTQRGWVVALVLSALFLSAMDTTIMGTLLPIIRETFDAPQLYPWLISGFLLALIIAMPLMGVLSDKFGEQVAMQLSLALFLAGSLLVGLSDNMQHLIIARVIQGMGSGGIVVLAYTIIGKVFTAEKRAKMQGLLSAVWGLAAIAGPMIGAGLHELVDWRWAFYLNLPIGLAVVLGFLVFYRSSSTKNSQSFDVFGFVVFALLATSALLWLQSSTLMLPSQLLTVLPFVVCLSLAVMLFTVNSKKGQAFLAYEFFQFPLGLNTCYILLSSIVMYASVTLLPILTIETLGRSLMSAGYLVLAASLGWVIAATLCGKWIGKLKAKLCVLVGFIAQTLGCAALLLVNDFTPTWWLLLSQLLVGLGIGFVATATLLYAQSHTDSQRLGKITASVQLYRNFGAALGVNGLAAMLLSSMAASPSIESFQQPFQVLIICALVGALLSLFLPNHRGI